MAEPTADLVVPEEEVKADEEAPEYFDPEDPLYGLEQRLQGLSLDDDSIRIIREKLIEA